MQFIKLIILYQEFYAFDNWLLSLGYGNRSLRIFSDKTDIFVRCCCKLSSSFFCILCMKHLILPIRTSIFIYTTLLMMYILISSA